LTRVVPTPIVLGRSIAPIPPTEDAVPVVADEDEDVDDPTTVAGACGTEDSMLAIKGKGSGQLLDRPPPLMSLNIYVLCCT